ncbi:hypothetical protein [Wenzhouxiangella limi]|uniref:Uncharacterized protein n=1 Tax=Wenzhouxiangella limi TaxID=2707351 RepID=A0A845V244_9GAMM|nr:hypothetical protein [Wenzhouxiangella limi]NDY96330.1 hypothetical protein [Wenzhouxiangella limi]
MRISCFGLLFGLIITLAWAVPRSEDDLFSDRFEGDLSSSTEVTPGVLSAVDDDLLLGSHPQALDASQRVTLKRRTPPEDLLGSERGERFRPLGDLIELIALDLEKETDLLQGKGRAAFILAIPVPSGGDTRRLVPMMKGWGQFSMQHEMDPREVPDIWMPINGVYDPDHQLYLVDLPTIGNAEFPTQVVLVEHPWMKTESTQPILDWLVEEYLPMAEKARPGERLPTWKTGPDWDPARSSDSPFDVRCDVAEGDPSVCGLDYNDLFTAMGPHLEDGLEEFETDMVGNPVPRLKTNAQDQYIYYLSDETTRWTCNSFSGFYNGVTTNAWTCTNALGSSNDVDAGLSTTRHELFHTIQFDYQLSPFRRWLTEGTAALVQYPNLIIHRQERPVDVGLQSTDQSFHYEAQHFWFDLLLRSGLADVRGVSRIFREGLTTTAAGSFVDIRTPFDTLGEAHWHWAANALFVGDIELPVRGASSSAGYRYTHRCEPNPGSMAGDIPTLTVSASTQKEIELDLDPLSATLVELVLPPRDQHHFYEIDYETTSWFSSGPMIQTFTEQSEPIEGGCSDLSGTLIRAYNQPGADNPEIDEGDAAVVASALSPAGQTEPRRAWILVSNPGEVRSSTFVLRVSPARTESDTYLDFPPLEEWKPVANDVEIEMDGNRFIEVPVVDNDEPGYLGGVLQIIDPVGSWLSTDAGNRYRAEMDATGEITLLKFGVEDIKFDGTDTMSYTVRNEHGFVDTATLTVNRSVTPTAQDFTVKTGVGAELLIDPREAVDNPANGSLMLDDSEPLGQFVGSLQLSATLSSLRVLEYTSGALTPDSALFGYVDRASYEISNRVGLTDSGIITIEVNRPQFELAFDTSPTFPPEITPCDLNFGSGLDGDLFAATGLSKDGLLRSSTRVRGVDFSVGSLGGDTGQTVLNAVTDDGLAFGWSSDAKGFVRPVIWNGVSLDVASGISRDSQGRLFDVTESGFLLGQQVDESGSRVLLLAEGQPVQLNQSELVGGHLALGASSRGDQFFGVYGLAEDPDFRAFSTSFLQPPGGGSPACGARFPTNGGLFAGGGAAFFYDIISTDFPERGNLYLLPSLGGDLTVPRAANAEGQVVGTSAVQDVPNRSTGAEKVLRAFIWSAQEGITELPSLGGGYTEALAVSETGVVAGTGLDADGRQSGFVWEQGLILNLNDLLPDDSAWHIVSATEIRSDGSLMAWAQNQRDEKAAPVPVIFRPAEGSFR